MKYTYIASLIVVLSLIGTGCTDDILPEKPSNNSDNDFNIEAFGDGYSLSFDVNLDPMGGTSTRANETVDDAQLVEWENHLDPEEFRILFFDSKDRFIFESRSRWFTKVEANDGKTHWRVGVPVFQYLSDNFDDIASNDAVQLDDDAKYNWEKIREILSSEDFKIAILANRPFNIDVPELSDLSAADRRVKTFGKNGPFWNYENSVANYDYPDDYPDKVKKVFDLHHCQYDPFYENKNIGGGRCYDFIMQDGVEDLGAAGVVTVPQMGAVSSWIRPDRQKTIGTSNVYIYRLPQATGLRDQYIPMYGIQKFSALSSWVKGTTFNLSEQTASQVGEYDYKAISLLRSVVKIELRIPVKDNNGRAVTVENDRALIFANNFLARCEPMDVSTPTDLIWQDNHKDDCEWNYIRNYGLYADGNSATADKYREKLSWFYGVWKEAGWDFKGVDVVSPTADTPYPRVFNPITQRLTSASIAECYLPIEGQFHRWVIYCGEKHINDPNSLNNLASSGQINFFRIGVHRNGGDYIYNIPLTDYSIDANPAHGSLTAEPYRDQNNNESLNSTGYPNVMNGSTSTTNPITGYFNEVMALNSSNNDRNGKYTYKDMYPYPMIRNHFYRVSVSFGDGDDINVEVIDGEKRTVGGIIFE